MADHQGLVASFIATARTPAEHAAKNEIDTLRREIALLEKEIQGLERQLAKAQKAAKK